VVDDFNGLTPCRHDYKTRSEKSLRPGCEGKIRKQSERIAHHEAASSFSLGYVRSFMHLDRTSLLFGLLAALANTFGGLVIVQTWRREYLKYFLALGSGFMLAAAFLEMIPTSFTLFHGSPVFVLGGYLIIHLFEHGLSPHFHFGEEVHTKEMLNPRVGISALIGLTSHSFFDGVAIASGFILSYQLGIIVFIAVMLHKLPEGFTVASIMMASGRGKSSSLLAAGGLGVATLLGILTMDVASGFVNYALPLSAGVTVYVAASDLMPEVNEEPGVKLSLSVFAGVMLFVLARAGLNRL
jgi:zinc transporter ZupT